MSATWIVLSVIAGAGLLMTFARFENARGQNATWGAATFGVIGGLIASAIYSLKGHGFDWLTVWKWVVVSVTISMLLDGIGVFVRLKLGQGRAALENEGGGLKKTDLEQLASRDPLVREALKTLLQAMGGLPEELREDSTLVESLSTLEHMASSEEASESVLGLLMSTIEYVIALRVDNLE